MKLAERLLDPGERGLLYEAVRRYAMEGVLVDALSRSETWQAVFEIMRSAQDKAIRNYEETCERNRRSALKRVEQTVYSAGSAGSAGSVGSAGCQSNLIESNRIKSNQIKRNGALTGDTASPQGEEVKGVPGVAWI